MWKVGVFSFWWTLGAQLGTEGAGSRTRSTRAIYGAACGGDTPRPAELAPGLLPGSVVLFIHSPDNKRVSMAADGFYWVLLGFIGSHWVLLSFYWT